MSVCLVGKKSKAKQTPSSDFVANFEQPDAPVVDRLTELERQIDVVRKSWETLARALTEINQSRLYRDKYETFEDYCEEKWDIGRARAYQLMEALGVKDGLSTNGRHPVPTSERQIRSLMGLEPEKQLQVWIEATKDNPNPSAQRIADLAEAYRLLSRDDAPETPELQDDTPAKEVKEEAEALLPSTSATSKNVAVAAQAVREPEEFVTSMNAQTDAEFKPPAVQKPVKAKTPKREAAPPSLQIDGVQPGTSEIGESDLLKISDAVRACAVELLRQFNRKKRLRVLDAALREWRTIREKYRTGAKN
jgi:hypothetical protein